METTAEQPAPDASSEQQGSELPGLRHLQRSTSDRMLAGVAGGGADYLHVDPIIVRAAFVVLSFFGGLGVVLYATGWLLMPEAGRPPASASILTGSRRHQGLVIVAALAFGIV